jgi:hypothetical protein
MTIVTSHYRYKRPPRKRATRSREERMQRHGSETVGPPPF